MKDLYWLTVLSNISDISIILIFFAAIAFLVFLVIHITISDGTYLDEGDRKVLSICRKGLKTSLATTVVSILFCVFIPSKQDMLIIYGIGGTIDYIQDNDKVKELPDKVIDACDAYLESIIDKNK